MTQPRLLLAFAVVLTTSGCSSTEPTATAAAEYARGKQDLGDGNYGLAIAHFKAAAQRNPDDIAALNGLGIAYAKLDRDDAAKSVFERALALDGTSALTRSNYAIFLGRREGRSPPAGPRATIDPPKNPDQVAAPPKAPASKAVFTISNGSGRSRLARRLQHYLSGRGFPVDRTANAGRFDHAQSVLFCHASSRAAAEDIRQALPAGVKLIELASKANTIELIAGSDLNAFDARLAFATATKGDPQ